MLGRFRKWVRDRFGPAYIKTMGQIFIHFHTNFLSLLFYFSKPLSPLSYLCSFFFWVPHGETDEYSSPPTKVRWGSGGGWPAGTAAPPRQNPNLYIFFIFLFSLLLLHFLLIFLILPSKFPFFTLSFPYGLHTAKQSTTIYIYIYIYIHTEKEKKRKGFYPLASGPVGFGCDLLGCTPDRTFAALVVISTGLIRL